MTIDQSQAMVIYVIVAVAFLITAACRARIFSEWIGLVISAIIFGIGVLVSYASSADPDTPTSLMLTCFACLFAGILLGTKFDPLNPFVVIGGGNKEDGEYLTKDEAIGVIGRRGVEVWPGLVIGFGLGFLAIVFVGFV